MQLRPRREKRIHRQHCSSCCRWILFCGSAKRTPGVREKRGGKRAGGGASRAPHRREGTESGVAWNEKERRCVVEARGESKRRTGESKRHAENRKGTRRIEKAHGRIEKARRRVEKQRVRNRKTRNRRIKASGPKSERVWGSKSESARARNQKACNLPTTL